MSVALPPLEYATRLPRVRDRIATDGLDAFLVTDLVNIRWITGFTGSAGRLVVTADRAVLVVDGRYVNQATDQLAIAGVEAEIVVGLSTAEQLAHLGAACGAGRIGFESEQVSVAEHARLTAAVAGSLVGATGLVETERRTKDDGEIARIERAAAIAGEALVEVLPGIEHGPTELELARRLDRAMLDLGAEDVSFATILASGPNGARPHARPGNRRIVEGDAIVIDFGALYEGYHSDMTRTLLYGEVHPWLSEGYVAVEAAQAAGVAAVRAGRPAVEVDAACRTSLIDAGFGDFFNHGTGHGVGLVIHESPWIRAQPGDVLADRDVVTVEPGVYRGELGGIRIEDTVVVTIDGCRALTPTPKDLSCLRSPRMTSRRE